MCYGVIGLIDLHYEMKQKPLCNAQSRKQSLCFVMNKYSCLQLHIIHSKHTNKCFYKTLIHTYNIISFLQDLQNTNINANSSSKASAPAKTENSNVAAPVYQSHRNVNPPISNGNHTATNGTPSNSNSVAEALPQSNGNNVFNKELLINKNTEDLPDGVDPTKKEVSKVRSKGK